MKRLRRILVGGLWLAAAVVGLAAVALVALQRGWLDGWARALVVHEVERATGARVELARLRVRLLPLRVELAGLILHGREAADEPPFVRLARLEADLQPTSLLRGPLRLRALRIEQPQIYVRVDASGGSNLPIPPVHRPRLPWYQQLFRVITARLDIERGQLTYNNRRIPLSVDGGQFQCALHYVAAAGGADAYLLAVSWEHMRLTASRYLPFASSWQARLTLGRRGGALDWFEWRLPHSTLQLWGQWPNWAEPAGQLRYRVRVDLEDVRTILRKPHSPLGILQSSGRISVDHRSWQLQGYYTAEDIRMQYKWYHAAQMQSRGSLHADPAGLVIPDFEAWALGGHLSGRIRMQPHGLRFTAETHAEKISLPELFAAVANRDLPLETLHWDGEVALEATTTWQADFKHMASRGTMTWKAPPVPRPGRLPASASFPYDYSMDRNAVVVTQGHITTPTSHLLLDGVIGARRSQLALELEARDLAEWADLINYLRGTTEPMLAGQVSWRGQLLGPVSGPLFVGQIHLRQPRYGRLRWDEIAGGVEYSPSELRLRAAQVRRGAARASLNLWLQLTDWGFRPENACRLEATLTAAPLEDLQELAGTHYPVEGLLSGQFRLNGTRAAPSLAGRFSVTRFAYRQYRSPLVTGWVHVERGRVEWEGLDATLGKGHLRGRFAYAWATGQTAFDLTGNDLPLEQIPPLEASALAVRGRLEFHLSGSGPLGAPRGQGSLSVRALELGGERFGDLSAHLQSDGRLLDAQLGSALVRGSLRGTLQLQLQDPYPIEGELQVAGFDLDPFVRAGLHLSGLTNHSQVDGQFRLAGLLKRPETLAVEAEVQRARFAVETVQLESRGPLHARYRNGQLVIGEANFRGPESDFHVHGTLDVRPASRLDLAISGTVNLRLAEGFVPRLDARGVAAVNATVQGSLGAPRLAGRARLQNASLRYGDIPVGLSQVSGELIFSTDRVSFTDLQASAGGGRLLLSGLLRYPSGQPLQYDIAITAHQVRIRYPEGMSWILDAQTRLTGSSQGALLSGRITVDRLLLVNGLDLAGWMMAARGQGTAPPSSSPFLANLNLDLQVDSGPGARLQWTGARLEADASLRVRGSWDRPAVLGHVHLLGGEMDFRGNRFRLTRGDLNFADPLRLDPVLNVEATTTVQQYEVTVDLTGRASALRLSYRSDPPLPETDVVALLALGTPGEASELRSATPVPPGQFGATALLSQAISSEVGGRLARLFGISRLEIDPFVSGTGTESTTAARLTIEQRVTPNLTITYSTNATSSAEQVIQIEYTVSRNLSIVALRDINGTFGIDIKFKKRFP